jgi:putative serine protease PepD
MNAVRRRVAIVASGVVLSAGIGAGTGIWAYDMSLGTPAAPAAVATIAQTATPAATTRSLATTAQPARLTAGQIYAAEAAGVVEIEVSSRASGAVGPQGQGGAATEAQGSGFVIDGQGDIVTNDHVVEGATAISVIFNDGTRATAKLVGADASSDLAVIKVNGGPHVTPLQLADSGNVRVGDPVVAISSPFGLENTATAGIVSALNRTIQSINGYTIAGVIQTDASINHGSSGSPLLDDQGHVIGVNSQIEGGQVDGNVGVGFAIPSTTVTKVVDQLIAGTTVAHPYLGVQLTTALAVGGSAAPGATVAAVTAGSPAAKAGLAAGDLITAVNGTAAPSADQVTAAIAALQPGQTVTLKVTRGGSSRTVSATLGQRPGG